MTSSAAALLREGERIMVVCNACRYCEGYCAVFPAMEQRMAFPAGDLRYLANLCHNCGECLYACQYAPPHEFAINVPRTFAQLRLESYEHYAWPAPLARAFRRHSVATSLGLSAVMIVIMLVAARATGNVAEPAQPADFYGVLPHGVMVALFGSVFGFVLVALAVGLTRFQRDVAGAEPAGPRLDRKSATRRGTRPTYQALRDILTLTNLHAHGRDCTVTGEEARTPWRRWFHHCTFYGFMLSFASTSVAALYHWFGDPAPYAYTSLPVFLGTAGGIGLMVGPAGLYWLGRRRDVEMTDPTQQPLDRGFIVLLLLTSVTGLALLALRATSDMPMLLIIHLGTVLALFVTLPYGKFVHGLYRAAALVGYARESRG